MSEAREYWILEHEEGDPYPYPTRKSALVGQALLGGKIVHVQEVQEGETGEAMPVKIAECDYWNKTGKCPKGGA